MALPPIYPPATPPTLPPLVALPLAEAGVLPKKKGSTNQGAPIFLPFRVQPFKATLYYLSLIHI